MLDAIFIVALVVSALLLFASVRASDGGDDAVARLSAMYAIYFVLLAICVRLVAGTS